jgi:hypothetical protein
MSFERDLLRELNELRRDPKGYSFKVQKYKDYFEGNILKIPGAQAGIKTEEGPAAYEEAIQFLKNASPADEMTPSKGLFYIASDFLGMVQKETDPNNLKNIDMDSIISRHGNFVGNFSRSMEFGGATPEQVIVNLLVSDGDKTRGQREALLNNNLKKVGVASGTHETYRTASIIVGCTQFENSSGNDDYSI